MVGEWETVYVLLSVLLGSLSHRGFFPTSVMIYVALTHPIISHVLEQCCPTLSNRVCVLVG